MKGEQVEKQGGQGEIIHALSPNSRFWPVSDLSWGRGDAINWIRVWAFEIRLD